MKLNIFLKEKNLDFHLKKTYGSWIDTEWTYYYWRNFLFIPNLWDEACFLVCLGFMAYQHL